MNYLENINPNYLDLMMPLQKWKILSVENLKSLSGFPGNVWNFYKAIRKLEQMELLKGFVDGFTNQKFLYLGEKGFKALGVEKIVPVHEENRFHDAHLVRMLLQLKCLPFTEDVLLDQQIKKELPLLKHLPDAIISGRRKEKFLLAVELELTQKSKERVREAFSSYEASPYFNNVLYLFNRQTPYQTYQEVLKDYVEIRNKEKFLFLYEPMLTRRTYEILKSELTFKGRTTTLQEVFSV